jgi:hypothetical protein
MEEFAEFQKIDLGVLSMSIVLLHKIKKDVQKRQCVCESLHSGKVQITF